MENDNNTVAYVPRKGRLATVMPGTLESVHQKSD